MAQLTFFPLGNADSCLIDLSNGKKLLFDFGDQKNGDDCADKRIDLAATLREDLKAAKKGSYDVFAVTHLDLDHVQGASEFFWLEHAKKYQGEGRIKIDELWVPAAVICEDRPDEDDARVIQCEARHRFKAGRGIRVFSGPCALEDWCQKNGLSLKDREALITNAGEVVPGLTKESDGVEFFAHCPFAHRTENGEELDRNDDALVVQATFAESGVETRLILGSDVTWEMWVEIVNLTRKYKRDERLEWDVFKLPHHCSYLSLGPEKGEEKTTPHKKVAWLYEVQGHEHGIVVSTSCPIPADDTDQPPHRQAANYHRDAARDRVGQFIVTMEHPTESSPEPLVIKIDRFKATIVKRQRSGIVMATAAAAPRAG
jgi:hypothetical protein